MVKFGSAAGGYTLVEMVIVVVVIGLLATIAVRYLGPVSDRAKLEETEKEMQQLARAVCGDPNLTFGGVHSDYGYVGDIGALPSSWDDLVTNPGYATWRGPYMPDHPADGSTSSTYWLDAWGQPYSSPNSILFSSSGGPTPLTRRLANSLADLLYNRVTVAVADLDGTVPGTAFADSVVVHLLYPNGSGGIATAVRSPGADGLTVFDSIPIGLHTLRLIFLATGDTLTRQVNIDVGRDYYAELHHFANLW